VGIEQQNRDLRNGIEIIVACPGRLLDHLWQGTISLSDLKVLVIDEADRMFDMGFLPDIRNILKCIMKPRQTLLFSATMPDDIRRLVREILHNPVTVQIGRTLPATTVSHALYPVGRHLKTALLKELLRKTDMESVLVFTCTKHRAERVAQQLKSGAIGQHHCKGTCPRASARPRLMASVTDCSRYWWRLILPLVASMFWIFHTSSTTTCQMVLMLIFTASGAPEELAELAMRSHS